MAQTLPSYALPSYALPSYALPSRALLLINEYSKPLTRPDWRNSKPIVTTFYLYKMVQNTSTFLTPLIYGMYINLMQTQWYGLYVYVRFNGLNRKFDESIMKIDGIQDALRFYLNKNIIE